MQSQQLFIKMALDAWNKENAKVDKIFDTFTEEQVKSEVAPGRNSGLYLLGHLVAVNDAMIPLLGFGEMLYPNLQNIFISNEDKSGLEKPSMAELKKCWHDINASLNKHFSEMQPGDWFTRHNSVSPEDFLNEPHRNKLNIIISRTIHQSYHLGQLVFLNATVAA